MSVSVRLPTKACAAFRSEQVVNSLFSAAVSADIEAMQRRLVPDSPGLGDVARLSALDGRMAGHLMGALVMAITVGMVSK